MFGTILQNWIQSAIARFVAKSQEIQAAPQISLAAKIKQYYLEHGYEWDEVNLIGIRCTEIPYSNQFKDLFLVVDNNAINKFLITTIPGTTWTPETRKKYGVSYEASICFGFHPHTHGIGTHHGYEALTQLGGPLKCYIDANKDGIQQTDERLTVENVGSGMNIHKSGVDGQARVGFSSAGCQVFPHWKDFWWVIDRVKNTEKFKANKKCLFNYLMVNSQEFPFMEEIRSM